MVKQSPKTGKSRDVSKTADKGKSMKSTTGFNDALSSSGVKFGGTIINLDSINIATYVCDFGNVVVNSSKKKSFRLTNVGRQHISFNFDKKLLQQAGITIEPDKAQKVAPNHSVLFNVLYTTRKNVFGNKKYLIPIDIKNGPRYSIEFIANLTIPELSMS